MLETVFVLSLFFFLFSAGAWTLALTYKGLRWTKNNLGEVLVNHFTTDKTKNHPRYFVGGLMIATIFAVLFQAIATSYHVTYNVFDKVYGKTKAMHMWVDGKIPDVIYYHDWEYTVSFKALLTPVMLAVSFVLIHIYVHRLMRNKLPGFLSRRGKVPKAVAKEV